MISLRNYVVSSAVVAAAVFYHAFATRRHFFPATLYLSTSKLAVAVVGNLSFATALCLYNLVIKVFLGSLREIELERVKEKLSSAIMETCLALTIFREEFNMGFVAMFAALTFVKVFHWLVQDRVDYIEVTPSVSRLAHVRIITFMGVLLALDCTFLQHTIAATLASGGHSVQLLFAFEYVILASSIVSTAAKYVMSMVDAAMEGRWEGKGAWVFYTELMTDMLHLLVYLVFFIIVFTHYGLPLHLIRDLYITFRNFRNRISDFLRFRQVTARMDRFPDATADDLARCHFTCVVCRDEMHAGGANKRLACGHVFHLHCLRSWLERSQSCPTCRTPVFRPAPAAPAGAAQGAAAAGAGGAPGAGVQQRAVFIQARIVAGPDGQQQLQMIGQPRAAPVAAAPGPPPAAAAAQQQPGAAAQEAAAPAADVAAAPAAAGAPAAAVPAVAPGPYWHPGAGAVPAAAGVMWQVPQWYPVTSMAAFANAPLQYASQQHASQAPPSLEQQALAAGMVPLLPMIPAISAPFSAMIAPQLGAGASPEQQAAAAAMAAAAAAMYATPMAGLAMMPPAMLPPALLQPGVGPAVPGLGGGGGGAGAGAAQGGGAGGAGGLSHQEQVAVTAATAAANAAAAAAAMMAGSASPEVVAGAMEATQQMLRRQLEYVQSQMDRIRSSQGHTGGAGPSTAAAAAPAAQAAAAPAAPDNAAAGAAQAEAAVPVVADQQAAAAQGDSGGRAVQQQEQGQGQAAELAAGEAAENDQAAELRRRRLARFGSGGGDPAANA